MAQDSGYLTPRRFAELLTDKGMPVTGPTVQRWCREGRITRVETPGGHYRIHVSQADVILAAPPPITADVS